MPKPFQFDTHNPHPDCFWLELRAEAAPANPQHLELWLTLRGDRQWQSLLDGRVQFGIRGGQLTLSWGESPVEAIASESGDRWPLSANGANSSLLVVPQSSPTALFWHFRSHPSQSVVRGTVSSLKLATLEVTGELQHLSATVTTQLADVVLSDVEGLWRHDITPNQHAVLDRAVARMLVETQLIPYLSRADLTSESVTAKIPRDRATANAETALKSLIEKLSAAQTDDFLELAQIAQLNPTEDFSGGNLLGANLSEIDFSGANLSRANLRGGELNDADLSDANLQGANLRGADLSGAYLSNTDLRGANLRRASLALANLGGANLSGANLQETNLSNANFSNTLVEQAQLGQNPGLSEETKQNLLQRGALWVN